MSTRIMSTELILFFSGELKCDIDIIKCCYVCASLFSGKILLTSKGMKDLEAYD